MTTKVVVLTDEDGLEAIYVDGECVFQDDTVYAIDIGRSVRDAGLMYFKHEVVSGLVDGFPKKLSDIPAEAFIGE